MEEQVAGLAQVPTLGRDRALVRLDPEPAPLELTGGDGEYVTGVVNFEALVAGQAVQVPRGFGGRARNARKYTESRGTTQPISEMNSSR